MSRHVGCHIIINHHALSQHRLLNPLIRSQIDWLGLYKCTNQKVVEVVFWEYLSQCSDIQGKDGFLREVRRQTKGTFDKKTRQLVPNYACLLVNIPSGRVSWDYADYFKDSMQKNMLDNKKKVSRCPKTRIQFVRTPQGVQLLQEREKDSPNETGGSARANIGAVQGRPSHQQAGGMNFREKWNRFLGTPSVYQKIVAMQSHPMKRLSVPLLEMS